MARIAAATLELFDMKRFDSGPMVVTCHRVPAAEKA
jgi:hypothetical protein